MRCLTSQHPRGAGRCGGPGGPYRQIELGCDVPPLLRALPPVVTLRPLVADPVERADVWPHITSVPVSGERKDVNDSEHPRPRRLNSSFESARP